MLLVGLLCALVESLIVWRKSCCCLDNELPYVGRFCLEGIEILFRNPELVRKGTPAIAGFLAGRVVDQLFKPVLWDKSDDLGFRAARFPPKEEIPECVLQARPSPTI